MDKHIFEALSIVVCQFDWGVLLSRESHKALFVQEDPQWVTTDHQYVNPNIKLEAIL